MSSKTIKTLDVRTRRQWRDWLREHHASEAEIWLVFPKRHTGETSLGYDDAVEEALCFGWIDSKGRALDEERGMLWFPFLCAPNLLPQKHRKGLS